MTAAETTKTPRSAQPPSSSRHLKEVELFKIREIRNVLEVPGASAAFVSAGPEPEEASARVTRLTARCANDPLPDLRLPRGVRHGEWRTDEAIYYLVFEEPA